jgi:hypothetical protein
MGYDCPMKDAISYLKTLSLMLEARKHGNGVREDRFLDELDIIWMKLSKREVALIDRISMFIARDILTLSNLKNLITRLEHKYSGPIVAVRVYLGKSNKREPRGTGTSSRQGTCFCRCGCHITGQRIFDLAKKPEAGLYPAQ